MSADNARYRNFRALSPESDKKWIDRYNFEGSLLQDEIARNQSVINVVTQDLSVASVAGNSLFSNNSLIVTTGRAFALYTYTTGDPTKTIVQDTLVNIRINKDLVETQFPCKHQRGFRGDFFQLFLNWPAQANITFDLVIYKFFCIAQLNKNSLL